MQKSAIFPIFPYIYIGKLAKSEQSVFLPNRQGPMKENTLNELTYMLGIHSSRDFFGPHVAIKMHKH